VLQMEPRASHMLGKRSTLSYPRPQPGVFFSVETLRSSIPYVTDQPEWTPGKLTEREGTRNPQTPERHPGVQVKPPGFHFPTALLLLSVHICSFLSQSFYFNSFIHSFFFLWY
jgi:hypothetical protein